MKNKKKMFYNEIRLCGNIDNILGPIMNTAGRACVIPY